MIEFTFPHYFGFDFYSLCPEFWEALDINISGQSVNGLSWHSSWAFVCKSRCLRSNTTQHDPTSGYWAATAISKYLNLWLTLTVLHFLGKSLIWGHKAFFLACKNCCPNGIFLLDFSGYLSLLCRSSIPSLPFPDYLPAEAPVQTTCLQDSERRGRDTPKENEGGVPRKSSSWHLPVEIQINSGEFPVELVPGNYLVERHVFDPDCSRNSREVSFCLVSAKTLKPEPKITSDIKPMKTKTRNKETSGPDGDLSTYPTLFFFVSGCSDLVSSSFFRSCSPSDWCVFSVFINLCFEFLPFSHLNFIFHVFVLC